MELGHASSSVGGSNAESGDTGDVLIAAKQEAASLRQVLAAVQEALVAATARIELLEAHLGLEAATGEPASPPRTLAEWKLSGWTAGAGTHVVTGEGLRTRREALGISQAAVAHAAHCSRGLVAEVERGKRRSAQTLAHLSSVLDKLEQQARRN